MSDVETAVEGSPSPLPYPLKRAELAIVKLSTLRAQLGPKRYRS